MFLKFYKYLNKKIKTLMKVKVFKSYKTKMKIKQFKFLWEILELQQDSYYLYCYFVNLKLKLIVMNIWKKDLSKTYLIL